jgi:hypothetical protein
MEKIKIARVQKLVRESIQDMVSRGEKLETNPHVLISTMLAELIFGISYHLGFEQTTEIVAQILQECASSYGYDMFVMHGDTDKLREKLDAVDGTRKSDNKIVH